MAMEVKGKVWECNGSLHNAEYIKWCEKERERERERFQKVDICACVCASVCVPPTGHVFLVPSLSKTHFSISYL